MSVAIDVSAVHPRSGGAGTYVHGLIGALPQAGIEPVLVARRSDSPSRWPGAGEFVGVAPSLRPLRLLWEQTGLVRALRRAAPNAEVLHSPHYTMPEHLSRRDRLCLARVVTVHDLTFFTRPQDHQRSKRMLFRRAIAKAAAEADAIVCVSEATAALLQEHAPPRCPVHVIHHGIDHTRFTAAVAANEREILQRLAVTVPFILHLGNISLLISFPIVFFLMGRWLENFPNKTTFGLYQYLLGVSILSVVILIIIVYQAIKVINMRIIESIKQE